MTGRTNRAPWFFVVSDTAIDAPAPAVDGAVIDETTRSGPIAISAYRVLLISLVSTCCPGPSALARR